MRCGRWILGPWVIVAKYINGLRLELKREVNFHSPETLEEGYHKV